MTIANNRVAPSSDIHESPLISNKFLTRLTFAVAILAALTVAISLAGRMIGEKIALAGHTEDSTIFDIVIGEDHVRLPANVIRFEEQRMSGFSERADVYLTWPEMNGYSNDERARFNDVNRAENLVFLQLSQSTMSKDMSGRVEPIYRHIFDGPATPGPAGLSLHQLKENSGYGDESILTGTLPDGELYAVRCILPESDALSTGADCQRDVHVGHDLSLLYRFSSRLLPQWQAMETAVTGYVQRRLVNTPDESRQGRTIKIH
ncbi:hypothetical protein [Sinorhizobium sp. BG8]|uniref:hypothetical protein n=1 Tax=Sinorhizobium sp. BG8 TaxID=2613773 RepID=UPI00193CE4A9|nr:hypothetical protein [Sinorhizobium sp. BG8]QRM55408.1 hypothetical protein F3Y30_13390 [Sinorhizobium sp. BG8]